VVARIRVAEVIQAAATLEVVVTRVALTGRTVAEVETQKPTKSWSN
jgi:hypothetical protein